MSHVIGSVEIGKLADLCLWKPAFFGAKPEMVIKGRSPFVFRALSLPMADSPGLKISAIGLPQGGFIAYAQMGDANASIPTPEPIINRPMFAALSSSSAGPVSLAFVSQRAAAAKVVVIPI